MIIRQDGVTVLTAFSKSVSDLTDEIMVEAERIDKEDPDPETTKSHMVDKKIREWFNRGGNLGYR